MNDPPELAATAAFHLADCYRVLERHSEAIRLLIAWLPRFQEAQSQSLMPEIALQAESLLVRELRLAPAGPATLAELESHYFEQLPAASWGSTTACRLLAQELVRRLSESHEYESAARWLNRMGEHTEDSVSAQAWLLDERFTLWMGWARYESQRGDNQHTIQLASELLCEALSLEQQVAVRFLLAEANFQERRWEESEGHFEWLAEVADGSLANAPWQATIALRRAEMLVATKRYSEARQLLVQAKDRYSEFSKSYEYDYLLARCAMAEIDFEAAHQYLVAVLASPQVTGSEAEARTAWMLGELYFLQRKYESAIAAYRRTVSLDQFPDWQSRALLQQAKCHELLGQSEPAIELYSKVAGTCVETAEKAQAIQRLSWLQSTHQKVQ
jgi:tetratricopeptide (TPR) repeat protein